MDHAYPSQGWLTYRQAAEAGGHVRQGERGVTVVYADRFIPDAEKERAREGGEDARSIPFLKRFTVFNVAQCEGLDEALGVDPAPLPARQIAPLGDAVIKASGVEFHVGGDKAFYVPNADYVQVPPPLAFHDTINWYRTALHELTHATGHVSRLGRDLRNAFGSKDYAREELIAKWAQPSSVPRWASCRPCVMRIILAHGLKCCAKTIGRFSAQPVRPAGRRIGFLRVMPKRMRP
jgi:antirestriction protein ArdC